MRCQGNSGCPAPEGAVFNGIQQDPADALAFEIRVDGYVDEMRACAVDTHNSAAGDVVFDFGNEHNPFRDLLLQSAGDIGEIRQSRFQGRIGAIQALF